MIFRYDYDQEFARLQYLNLIYALTRIMRGYGFIIFLNLVIYSRDPFVYSYEKNMSLKEAFYECIHIDLDTALQLNEDKDLM